MMRAKLLAILTSLLLVSGICFADKSGEAVSHVYVEVVANVAVAVVDATVELGQIQTGPFDGTITFRVDANVETIDLQVAVTDLYKGDSLTAEATIPVAQGAGVTVQPANGDRRASCRERV
jgi:type 1 fimbria pilin